MVHGRAFYESPSSFLLISSNLKVAIFFLTGSWSKSQKLQFNTFSSGMAFKLISVVTRFVYNGA